MEHLRQFLAHGPAPELGWPARRAAVPAPAASHARVDEAEVALRLCNVHDDAALERLAQLEGRPLVAGRFVVAEVDGTLVAAQPLAGGAVLADPFVPTTHILPLLRLRAEQLARPEQPHRLRRVRHWSLIRGSIHA